jgi:hypothetical protein
MNMTINYYGYDQCWKMITRTNPDFFGSPPASQKRPDRLKVTFSPDGSFEGTVNF